MGGVPNTIHTPDPPSPFATLCRLSSRLFGATLFASPVPPWGPLARCEGVVSTRMRSPRNDNAHSFPLPAHFVLLSFLSRGEAMQMCVPTGCGKKSQPVGTAHWAASRADVSRLSGGLLGVLHSGSWEAHSHPARNRRSSHLARNKTGKKKKKQNGRGFIFAGRKNASSWQCGLCYVGCLLGLRFRLVIWLYQRLAWHFLFVATRTQRLADGGLHQKQKGSAMPLCLYIFPRRGRSHGDDD